MQYALYTFDKKAINKNLKKIDTISLYAMLLTASQHFLS